MYRLAEITRDIAGGVRLVTVPRHDFTLNLLKMCTH